MESDTDGIGQKFFAEESERAESDGATFHLLETAVIDQTIELVRVMTFRLESWSRWP